MSTLQTVKTQYVKANNGVTFAYRRLGPEQGVPLVLHIHFRANMDFWDPLFINTLAAARPIIIFDQAGVGRSTGIAQSTFQGWADDLLSFVEALNIKTIDLFGFSLGGCCVQVAALTNPSLVRCLLLAGTTASNPFQQVTGTVWPREIAPPEPIHDLMTAVSVAEGKRAIAFSFFPDNEIGRKDAEDYWNRIQERTAEDLRLDLLNESGTKSQREASVVKDRSEDQSWFHRLGELKMPVLIANGDNDVLIPSSRSWELLTQIEDAKLIIYPRAGHGFLWQCAEQFAADILQFLDHAENCKIQPKL